MIKSTLLFVLFTNLVLALPNNTFIIKNKDGKVLKGKKVNHMKNVYYDDLIKEQNELLKALEVIDKKKKEMNFDESYLFVDDGSYAKNHIVKNAKKYLGGKYVWGGTLPKGFDCSGYVQYVYRKGGVVLPRTALQQSKVGKPIADIENLQKGDLLFFLTDKKRNIPVTHVGIYLGNDKFIHAASTKKGIIISSLSKSRYGRILVKATRIIQ